MVGSFNRTAVNEIRASLTLEDTPSGIVGAEYPTQDDLRVVAHEYSITGGDSLAIEIYELRRRQESFQVQAQVTTEGLVNLPVVGRVSAAGLTVLEFEDALAEALRDREILLDPEVTVSPLYLQQATFSIFGIGVSASYNAGLRAGTFPIRRPDLCLLEAINQVGGLSEFVTDVYVFRTEEPLEVSPGELEPIEGVEVGARRDSPTSTDSRTSTGGEPEAAEGADETSARLLEEAVMDVVLGEEKEGARGDSRTSTGSPTSYEERAQQEEIEDDLSEVPEPSPWTYVNGEFIENPTYEAEGSVGRAMPDNHARRRAEPDLPAVTSAVNWARLAGESTYRILRIPADQLREGNLEVNVVVRAGDVIRIISGEIGLYYVMGQVNRVGPFAFNTEPITLKAAIAAAGGLSSLAWPDRCTVYRRLGQREQMIQVNLDRVFAGKDPDFYVKRGDIINVGTHPLAPFLQRIRSWTLPNPTSSVGYSFSYARNFADIDSFSVRRNPHNEADTFPALFP